VRLISPNAVFNALNQMGRKQTSQWGRALAHKSLLFMVSFVMERKPVRDKPNCIITTITLLHGC